MILMYFPDDESVSLVKENSVINNNKEELKRGCLCSVKERSKIYNGVVIEVVKSTIVAMLCFINYAPCIL